MSSWAGNLIKVARHDAAMSQRELARRAGTSQATVSAYEAGHKSPSFGTLVRLIRSTGQDLRIRLEPLEGHDESVLAYEASLPVKTRAARRKHDLGLINKARLERGLDPVGAKDLM